MRSDTSLPPRGRGTVLRNARRLLGLLTAFVLPCGAQSTAGAAVYPSPMALEAHALERWAAGDTVTARREIAVASAYRWLHQPYRYGGIGYDGIDCSALMRASYRRAGLDLPRTSREQARVGVAIPRDPTILAPGDLLVFGRGNQVSHVGMALGGGYFVHAAGKATGVIVSRITERRWQSLWMGTRRVIGTETN